MSDAADILTGADTLDGTATIDGEEIAFEMENPTRADLEAVDDELPDDTDPFEVAYAYIDAFLVEPDIDADDIPAGFALGLHEQMQRRVVQSSGIDDALDEMPLDDEGNG